MAVTSRFTYELTSTLVGTHDFAPPGSALRLAGQLDLINGTGAGAADRVFADQRTINASSNDDLDLAGVLTDALGTALTFLRIKLLYIRAADANVNNVVVGAAASNQFATLLNTTGTVTLRPGSFLIAANGSADATGWAVTAGTGDLLRVANSGAGTSVNYDIAVVGCSA